MPNKFPKPPFPEDIPEKVGVLLINLGTPDAPTAKAIRPYLAQFLHDWRVIEVSRWVWCLILHGFILRIRPGKIASAYATIWTDEGSPLLAITKRQANKLSKKLSNYEVAYAMRYGNPSVSLAMNSLHLANCRKLLVLPMYPQYSSATTASSLDAVFDELKTWRWMPEVRTINSYATDPRYISALANSLQRVWKKDKPFEKLVISFHGTPEKFRDLGDPYYYQCKATSEALAKALKLQDDQWILCFQSQFGNDPWIKPSTSGTLKSLGEQGVKSVDVICPGFSADCLETLEEIEEENREVFEEAGGTHFRYIPALNDNDDHIEALEKIINNHVFGWNDAS